MAVPKDPGARWWPLVFLIVLAVSAIVWVQTAGDRSGQERVLLTLLIGVLLILTSIVWLVFASRMPWLRRFKALLAIVSTSLVVSLLFEIEGVTGNLRPIVGWRWSGSDSNGIAATGRGIDLDGEVQPGLASSSYPAFLGPDGNATLAGPSLADDWNSEPPREVWRRAVGPAWSAFSVSRGLAVTQEQEDEYELVTAYDFLTGEPIWRHTDRARYESTIGGVGPRATPTIADQTVFTLGATGILNALDLTTGDGIWSTDILEDSDAKNQEWGKAGSPLVWHDLVIVSAGGSAGKSMLAYRLDDGKLVWSGGSDRSGYSSPKIVSLAGREQIVILNYSSVAAHEPQSGTVLWEYPWSRDNPNVAQPVPISANTVLVSTGYGIGSKLLRIDADDLGSLSAELVWESRRLKAKFANFVNFEGDVYGLDDGVLVCLDPATGERRWKKGRYGHGQLLLVDDRLLVLTETGLLVLIRPQAERLEELGTIQVLEGKTWNNPALVGPYLLVRNHREAALYELPLRAE